MSSVRSPDGPPASSERTKKQTWWRRVSATVLAAGALATAVTAIRELLPDPPPVHRVVINSADIITQPLSTFVATATIRPLTGGNLINPFQALPDLASTETPGPTAGSAEATTDGSGGSSSAPSSSDASGTSSSSPTPASSSPSSSSPSSSAQTSSGPTPFDASGLPPPAILDIPTDERNQFNEALHRSPQLRQLALPAEVLQGPVGDPEHGQVRFSRSGAVDANGDPLPVEEVARNLAAQLEQVRSVPIEGKRDPVGVRVTVDLELQGLRGVDLYLYWRLQAAGGSYPVPENLAVATPAFMITPGTDLDSASVDTWVPLPEDPGPYQLQLLVTDGTDPTPLDSLRSQPFD